MPARTKTKRTTMSLQRQTYLVVGTLVLLGLALGRWLSPWWLLLPTLMGVGMIVARVIGYCNMTRLLSKLPLERATLRQDLICTCPF